MKALNGLAFVLTLLVGLFCWGLWAFEPGLLVGTPWGQLHVAWGLAGAFVLGAVVVGVYVFTTWMLHRSAMQRRGRELRNTKSELESLKKQQVEPIIETPVIPDRF